MTLTTFLIWVPIAILLALVIKNYWQEILIISLVLQVIGIIVFGSLMSAFVWFLFFGDNDRWEGFKLLWLFHSILWTLGVGVYLSIFMDLAGYAVDLVRYIFKIK